MSTNLQKLGFIKGYNLYPFQEAIIVGLRDSFNKTNQAGLLAFTVAGKTFIASAVAAEFIKNHKNEKVLWFGDNSSNNNVKGKMESILNPKIMERINFVSYELLSRISDGDIPNDMVDGVGFMIFDECHRSWANNSRKAITSIFRLKPNARRLAMSATPIRPSDSIDTFRKLVPEAYNHNLIVKYDLSKASKNNLINPIKYIVAKNNFTTADLDYVERFKDVAYAYPDTKDAYDKLVAAITEYNKSKANKLYAALSDYIGVTKRPGGKNNREGERHMVFFPKIEDIKSNIDVIKKTFTRLYPGFKINVYEYHTKTSQYARDKVLKDAVHSKVKLENIDIILTVDMGAHSIHPDGIKSILMMRNTASTIIFQQQIGRVMSLRANDKSVIPADYIFDFSDSLNLFGQMTVGRGERALDNRLALPNVGSATQTFADLLIHLNKLLGGSISIQTITATSTLMKKLTDYSRLAKICNSRKYPLDLRRIIAHYSGNTTFNQYPSFDNLKRIYTSDPNRPKIYTSIGGIELWYNDAKQKILNRVIGDIEYCNVDLINEIGKTMYLDGRYCKTNNKTYSDLFLMHLGDMIIAELDGKDSYADLSDNTKKGYNLIIEAWKTGALPTNVTVYLENIGMSFTESENTAPDALLSWAGGISAEALENLRELRDLLKLASKASSDKQEYEYWVQIIALKYYILGKYDSVNEYRNVSYAISELTKNYSALLRAYHIPEGMTDSQYVNFSATCKAMKNQATITGVYQDILFGKYCRLDCCDKIEKLIADKFGFDDHSFNKTAVTKCKWMQDVDREAANNNLEGLKRELSFGVASKNPYRVTAATQIAKRFGIEL